jgi:hypothetical protein
MLINKNKDTINNLGIKNAQNVDYHDLENE